MKTLNTQRTGLISFSFIACLLSLVLAASLCAAPAAFGATSLEKQAEADALMQKLDTIQTELNTVTAEYEQSLADHEAATAAMEAEQQRIDETDMQIAALQIRLGDRAASMYKSGTISFIDVLLGASSFDEFLTTWDMVAKISSNDAAMVQESKDLRQTALDARSAYETQQKNAQAALEKSEQTKNQMEATLAGMRDEIENITAEIAELQAQEELQAEAARQAKEAEERAQQERQKEQVSQVTPPIIGSGQFGHPLPGASVTSGYGYRDFDSSFHQGIDFAAGTGTPYYAAAGGTVTVAGTSASAGNWILINHGNGLATRYLHSSELYVSVGDQVTQGQVIGAVGSTGNSSGPHLHFGVTVNGAYVNPLSYL